MPQKPHYVLAVVIAAAILCLPLLAQQPTENIGGRPAAAQQVLVKFRAPNIAVVQALRQLFDADDVRQIGGATGPYLFHSKSIPVIALLGILAGRAEISYFEPDYIVHSSAVPNDPNFSQLWGLKNTGLPGADISAVPAWDISTGSAANVVGVVDTGLDYRHPDLAANIWTASTAFTVNLSGGPITCPAGSHGYNAITRSCDPLDDNGHGTHVSGTIGAVGNNAAGVVGVNWNTKIIGLKFLDSTGNGSTSNAVDAIEFAIQVKAAFAGTATPVNVRVLSNSWGGTGFSQSLLDEINKANTNDMLFVAAAGNSATNLDTGTPSYPASFTAANIVAVAATDGSDSLASFSNYGKKTVHLGAPGVSILSTLPNASYGYLSGTSMATPHVSGAAALVLSACTLNSASLKTTLLNNVDPLASLAAITVTGGRLNVNKAIRSCAQTSSASSLWSSSTVPANPWYNDAPVTLGVKFRSDVTGTVTGIRFYKGLGNNGTHIGSLYTSTGTLLAQATFSGETASGWQQVNFSSAVSIAANTTYIAAYFTTSGFADDQNYFTSTGIDNAPLHALRSGVDGPNGVYIYGSSPQFPSQSWLNSNYWVDIAFSAGGSPPPPPPPSANSVWGGAASPGNPWANDSQPVTLGMKFRSDLTGTVTGIRFYKGLGNNGTHIGLLYNSAGTLLAQATFTGETASAWQQVNFSSPVSISANTTYIAAYFTTSGYAYDPNYFTSIGVDNAPLHALRSGVDGANGVYMYAGSPQFPSQSWLNANYWVDVAFAAGTTPPPPTGTSVWSSSGAPANPWLNDAHPVTLGMKFRSDAAGTISGIRFFKGTGNNGTHTGLLYSSTGALLAQATFSGETVSGWQQVNFPSPVNISANTTYVAAYFTTSGYAYDTNYFTSIGVDNAPLHALQSGVDGANGVYMYAGSPQFPSQSWLNANYWVDIVFAP